MKTLKVVTAIILIFALGLFSGALGTKVYLKYKFKQIAEGKPAHHTRILMNRLTKELDLTDTQQKQIKEILDSSMRDFRKMRKELLPQILGPLSLNFEQIKTILNDEQQEKLDALLAKRFHDIPRKHFSHSKRNRRPHDLSLEKLEEKLQLTDEQIAKIRPILENFSQEQKILMRKNRNRLEENRKILEKDMAKLKRATTDRLQPIMTPQQRARYNELRPHKALPEQRSP